MTKPLYLQLSEEIRDCFGPDSPWDVNPKLTIVDKDYRLHGAIIVPVDLWKDFEKGIQKAFETFGQLHAVGIYSEGHLTETHKETGELLADHVESRIVTTWDGVKSSTALLKRGETEWDVVEELIEEMPETNIKSVITSSTLFLKKGTPL